MKRGTFIVLEGIDGAGTTTHCRLLKEWLVSNGIEVLLTKEPTEGKIGRLLRQYLSRDSGSNDSIVEALLFAADRQEHQNQITDALERGKIVISDRYIESSICYQGLHLDEEFIHTINKHATKPDITIILDIPAAISCNRKLMTEKYETLEILERVRDRFLKRAEEENYLVISTAAEIKEVQEKIKEIFKPIFFKE